ncbi:hypothetical protein D3C71_915820 [compost metagenome]
MDDKEIDRLAEQLFDRENNDPKLSWEAVFAPRDPFGQASDVAGIGEETREKYRRRVRQGER